MSELKNVLELSLLRISDVLFVVFRQSRERCPGQRHLSLFLQSARRGCLAKHSKSQRLRPVHEGSFDAIASSPRVRFPPESGHSAARFACPVFPLNSPSSLSCIDCGTICRPLHSGEAEEAPNEHEGSLPDKSSRIIRSGAERV
jgi:hypothetical protein